MASFEDLPTETQILVLQHLSTMDLRSFLTSQATCRTFRLLAKEVLSHPQAVPQTGWPDLFHSVSLSVNYVLARHFGPLFASATCFTEAEHNRTRWYLSLEGDVARPFRRLPWAAAASGGGGDGEAGALLRELYLRPGASWRDVSVTHARAAPITRLEIIKSYSSEDLNEEGRDDVQYLLVDLPQPSTGGGEGFLTMGLLYDLLLCGGEVGDGSAATFGGETGAWDLMLGKRLRSHDLLVEYECFIHNDDDLVDSSIEAEGSAILYVRGAPVDVGDQDRLFLDLGDDDIGWAPEILGDRPRIRPAVVS